MKTNILLLLCGLLLAIMPAEARKVSKADKTAENAKAFQEMEKLVAGRHFQIEINRVYPQYGFDVSRFNPTGSILVQDSVARGHLPFFGRAYSLPYGENGGIDFDNTMQRVSIKTVKRRKEKIIVMSFSVRGTYDVYQMTIEAASNGTCSVSLNSNQRAQISYGGTISPLKEE